MAHSGPAVNWQNLPIGKQFCRHSIYIKKKWWFAETVDECWRYAHLVNCDIYRLDCIGCL